MANDFYSQDAGEEEYARLNEQEAELYYHEQELYESEKQKMTNNMTFWESVKKTDPKRVKPITGKQYKGNSPQPYYLVERMTEQFGMCGLGWGINIINERMERLTETDVLNVAVVEIWYMLGDKRGCITQIGQTKACYKTAAGGMMIDEDAPKKSVTDAMTKCMSYLGFAGDIFSGQWDDSKYVSEITKEFNKQSPAPNLQPPPFGATEQADCIKFMNECADMDALKGVFGGAYKRGNDLQKKTLSDVYNAKKLLLEKAV
jgi:hypothetical protein